MVVPDADNGFERRGGLRAAASLKVTYTSVDELVEAYTEDISRGGLFVRTTELLPIGEVVRVQVEMPDGGPVYAGFARVAHTIGREAVAAGRSPGMGLEFLDAGEAPLANEIARHLAATGHDEPVPPAPAGVSGRILVVDNDDAARELAAGVIRDAGHTVAVARNGMDAIRKALDDPPDLIVTDVDMPALDGWQFLRLLRARPELEHVPVIVLAGRLTDDERLRGYQNGVNDYVTVPYADDELALHVQRALERARAYPNRTAALTGYIAHVSIARLLTLLSSEQREGRLYVSDRKRVATAYLRDGQVVRVDVPEDQEHLDGAGRLLWLLDWIDGRFEFIPAAVSDPDSVGLSTPQALLRHARADAEPPTGP
ncbi:MAG: response regulator [Deltaproteobacteria bacterium]|nr:MAG: response regulator [Deltaproteobacteria bacterium]